MNALAVSLGILALAGIVYGLAKDDPEPAVGGLAVGLIALVIGLPS